MYSYYLQERQLSFVMFFFNTVNECYFFLARLCGVFFSWSGLSAPMFHGRVSAPVFHGRVYLRPLILKLLVLFVFTQ